MFTSDDNGHTSNNARATNSPSYPEIDPHSHASQPMTFNSSFGTVWTARPTTSPNPAAEPPSRQPSGLQDKSHQPDLKPLREPGQPAKRAAAPWRRCTRNQPASKNRPLRNHSLRVTTLPIIAVHQLLVRPHAVTVRDSARQPSVAIRGGIQTNRNLRPLTGIDAKNPPQ